MIEQSEYFRKAEPAYIRRHRITSAATGFVIGVSADVLAQAAHLKDVVLSAGTDTIALNSTTINPVEIGVAGLATAAIVYVAAEAFRRKELAYLRRYVNTNAPVKISQKTPQEVPQKPLLNVSETVQKPSEETS